MTKFPLEKELGKMRKALAKSIASKPLSSKANAIERLKHKICSHFVQFHNEHQLTQKEFAKKLDIDVALMSKILHYHTDEFTTDRLLRYLSIIYPNLDIHLDVA
jgi:predicted XRE-type DNA-binding protein